MASCRQAARPEREGKRMNIYTLLVNNDEGNLVRLPFSTLEKAQNFIKDNFINDNPRKVDPMLFEGRKNIYVIYDQLLDQVSF